MSSKVSLVAVKPHPYAGTLRKKGDTFEATARHAAILKALGNAADAPPPAAPTPKPATFAPTRGLEPPAPPPESKPKPKRREAAAEEQ